MKEKKKSLYEQYMNVKNQHMNAVVLLQVGGFYQTYYYDAVITADICGVNITARPLGEGKNCISCGFPVTSIDDKASSLVLKGYKVVVCNEVIDPVTKVKVRKVARVHEVLAGTFIDITTESEQYLEKYESYSDEDIRKEYNLSPKTPRKKAEEKVAQPTISVREELDMAEFLMRDVEEDTQEVLDFTSKKETSELDAIIKSITRDNDEPLQIRAYGLLDELKNLSVLHLSPYKALQLVNYWQEKYTDNNHGTLPWEEI